MLKHVFIGVAAGTAALFLITACAEESAENTQTQATETSVGSNQQGANVMQQPVDFSTPEQIIAKMKR